MTKIWQICEGTETTNYNNGKTITQICHSEHIHNLPYPKAEKIGHLDAKGGHFCKFK